jgi:toxin CcdB
MAQFDVYRSTRSKRFPFVVEVQDDLLSRLESRVVVPLTTVASYGARPITRLHPLVTLDGTEYILLTHQLASVPASVLVHPHGSIAEHRGRIINALDLLLTGS